MRLILLRSKSWTSSLVIRNKLTHYWKSGRLLSEGYAPTGLFPMYLPLRTPTSKELGESFDKVQVWIRDIKTCEKTSGVTLEWKTINNRQLGRNEIPVAILIQDLNTALNWLGKKKTQQMFLTCAENLLHKLPLLTSWVIKNPHQLIQLECQIEKFIAIVQWLKDNPRPRIYIRQLNLPGIDTKFIEMHKKTLAEWFDLCLPESAIHSQWNASHHFTRRYGFLEKPQLVRFRILDNSLYINGIKDLTVTAEAFAALDLPLSTVFVIENDINALTFPDYSQAIVLFGRGYGFDFLSREHWLKNKKVYYWGDIDTHGFAILNQFRKIIPHAQSLLMDEHTLLGHRAHWTEETKPSKATLSELHLHELQLYKALQENHWGENIRLEQEYLYYEHVLQTIAALNKYPL